MGALDIGYVRLPFKTVLKSSVGSEFISATVFPCVASIALLVEGFP